MKQYLIFTYIRILIIFFSAHLHCGSKILDALNPAPRFAPLPRSSFAEFTANDDIELLVEGYSSTVESFSNGYIENVSILSYKMFIPDKEDFARQVIQIITDNSLKGMLFSYDVDGYPNELNITVYLNESSCRNGNSVFRISYTQDQQFNFMYNIKDNPEKFTLEILEE